MHIEKITSSILNLAYYPDYGDDMELVKIAVSHNGWALKDASARCRKNREIVKIAVSHIGEALQYAPDFNDDDELTRIVLSQNGANLEFCSERIKSNKDIAYQALEDNAYSINYVSESLKKDIDIALWLIDYGKTRYMHVMSQEIQDIFYLHGRSGLIEKRKDNLDKILPEKNTQKTVKI